MSNALTPNSKLYFIFQGVLDANVMGGLPKYRDAFFTEDFIQNNPDSAAHVSKLRGLILDQVPMILFDTRTCMFISGRSS